ncbi:Serine carboxypeptidase-like [Trichinella spiralis]|uniref:Serine carboxypeptidase-like n=1 Tax=Trichinella spiralis TaxID=6334 RepID=A0ABR3KJT0_TRISP
MYFLIKINGFTRWPRAWPTGDIIRSYQPSHQQLMQQFPVYMYRDVYMIWATTSTYRSYAGKFYPAFRMDTAHVTQQPTNSRGGLELGLPAT